MRVGEEGMAPGFDPSVVFLAGVEGFMPHLVAWEDHTSTPILVTEDLSHHHWPPPWDERRVALVPEAVAAVRASGKNAARLNRNESGVPPPTTCAITTGPINPPPLLTGHDLYQHGLTPGPEFKWLLDQVREAQLDRTIQLA